MRGFVYEFGEGVQCGTKLVRIHLAYRLLEEWQLRFINPCIASYVAMHRTQLKSLKLYICFRSKKQII